MAKEIDREQRGTEPGGEVAKGGGSQVRAALEGQPRLETPAQRFDELATDQRESPADDHHFRREHGGDNR